MSERECIIILSKAWGHLIRCAYDDFRITTLETTKELMELKMELIE